MRWISFAEKNDNNTPFNVLKLTYIDAQFRCIEEYLRRTIYNINMKKSSTFTFLYMAIFWTKKLLFCIFFFIENVVIRWSVIHLALS